FGCDLPPSARTCEDAPLEPLVKESRILVGRCPVPRPQLDLSAIGFPRGHAKRKTDPAAQAAHSLRWRYLRKENLAGARLSNKRFIRKSHAKVSGQMTTPDTKLSVDVLQKTSILRGTV
ncbi:MAG: hypothetical protein KJ871_06330, partial [Alphaproteobacteria bacterium]|nr:hypothetical protein [Alphaproteobacteria bacterium]